MQVFEHDSVTQALLAKTLRDVPAEPDPLTISRSIARGTTIIGLMLDDLGDTRGGWKRPAGAVTRFGAVAWGLVELAAPRSLGQILFQYWTSIVYALALLMVLIGFLTGAGAVTRAGFLALGVAVLVNIVVEKLRRWMRTRDGRQLRPVLLIVPLVLAVLGGVVVASLIADLENQMDKNGAKLQFKWNRAGALKAHSDVANVLGTKYTNSNVRLMTAGLGWDSLFILCYTVAFLSLGWILATHFDHPNRAFAWVVIPTLVTVACDVIENLQAYFALFDIRGLAPMWTSDLKLQAAGFTLLILVFQAIVLRIEASAGRA